MSQNHAFGCRLQTDIFCKVSTEKLFPCNRWMHQNTLLSGGELQHSSPFLCVLYFYPLFQKQNEQDRQDTWSHGFMWKTPPTSLRQRYKRWKQLLSPDWTMKWDFTNTFAFVGKHIPLFRRYPLQIQQLFREVNTHRHFTLGTIAPKLKPWFKGVFAAYFRRCENTTPSRCLARGFLRRQIWWRWQSMAAKQLPKHKAENDFLWSQQHQNTMCLCLFSFREKPNSSQDSSLLKFNLAQSTLICIFLYTLTYSNYTHTLS